MNTTTTDSVFSLDATVGAIVRDRPATARLFEKLGIDFCCGGKRPLAEALKARGLDPATGAAMLDTMAAGLDARADDGLDVSGLSLSALADHIERTHHAYVRSELPRLSEMAGRVARKHAWRDARLSEVFATVEALAAEMSSHIEKEERILFPLIRQIEAGAADDFHCGSVANPIRQMEHEHDDAGRALATLRTLTDGFRPAADACNTHRALLDGLEAFESDLHRHVHKENNILFPRAIELAAGPGDR